MFGARSHDLPSNSVCKEKRRLAWVLLLFLLLVLQRVKGPGGGADELRLEMKPTESRDRREARV